MIARACRERQPLTPEQQALAERYLPLARSLARPYQVSWPDSRDEFESAACLALVEAAESYAPDREIRFATFASLRITGAMRDVQRKRVPLGYRDDPERAPLRLPITTPHWAEENGRVLGYEPDAPVGRELEAIEAVESWLRKLPPKHAAVMRRVYLLGETITAGARALGISPSRAVYIHRESLFLLRESEERRCSF